MGALALTVTVSVSAGTHTFELYGSGYDASAELPHGLYLGFYEESATALHVRYNGVGTSAVSTPAPSARRTGSPEPGPSD